MHRFDLGGLRAKPGYTTVNLVDPTDIRADITALDSFADNNSVEEFYLSHTLEHVPTVKYRQFLLDMWRKLAPGGKVTVIQTDIERVIQQWTAGQLSWRAMRTTVFTPTDRLRGNPFQAHQNMWGAEDLARDFTALGYSRVETFDAGAWAFDMMDEILPQECTPYHGVPIKNLGVVAYK